jgi:hypothetical protein
VLAAWLAKYGAAAVDKFDTDQEIDLGGLLSVILAAHESGAAPLRRLAVWITWRTGVAAMRSLHVEPLVVQWLAKPDRLGNRRWQRLVEVSRALEPKMSQDQMRKLMSFCRGMLGRKPVIDETQLQEVASALLVATGQARRTDPPVPLTGMLGRISVLGRALTPDEQEEIAQPELLTAQLQLIEDVRAEVVAENLVLPLMPPLHQLTTARRAQAKALLNDAVKALEAAAAPSC